MSTASRARRVPSSHARSLATSLAQYGARLDLSCATCYQHYFLSYVLNKSPLFLNMRFIGKNIAKISVFFSIKFILGIVIKKLFKQSNCCYYFFLNNRKTVSIHLFNAHNKLQNGLKVVLIR